MPLTAFQEQAASSRGGARLVSAAAGSGKTRVLVERLMRYVEEGANIDEFLVITYTRAAAGELRSRILSELNRRIAMDPANRRLRRQTELCCRASIGTIDSLCGRFLRENAHLAGIAPDFRVLEADRAQLLRQGVLDRLLEELYVDLESRPGLRALVDTVGAGRDDRRLAELVLRLHEAVQSHPDPLAWIDERKRDMTAPATGDAGDTVWGRYLLDLYGDQADYWARRLEALLGDMAAPGREPLLAAYGESLAATAEGLRAFQAAAGRGWDTASAHCILSFPRLRPYRGEDPLADSIKLARKECQALGERLGQIFGCLSAPLLAEQESTRPAMEALLDLTASLDRAYAREKRRQSVVDFSDQEHLVLRLLEDEGTGLAATLSARYREVLVDEYQDVNACQDRLFTLLSGGGRKLFMVGDVKQSIYRFRLADPGLFLARYRAYPSVTEDTPPGVPGRILLQENFRSRPCVVDGVNHVFRNIMSRNLGELDYDDSAALRPGREYPAEGGAPSELCILSLAGDGGENEGAAEEESQRPDRIALEAVLVARQIRQMVEEGFPVTQEAGTRPAEYGDFAILLRSYKSAAGRFRAALAAEGIPSVAQQGGGFFRSLEVTVLLSLLAVIDNPRQDVPLIAVLRSPLYGFTPDELSEIRTFDQTGSFWSALTRAAGKLPRCRDFLRELEEYRALAPDLTVEELLGAACARTDLFALLSAMPDGAARRENVQQLMDYARQFELDGYRGLFGFLGWMRRLEARGEEPRTGSVERAGAVEIMSIHRSKGLEFPVVFLAGTGRRFNRSDLRRNVLLHPEMGLGAKITDTRRGVEYPSMAWQAVKARLEREMLSEEMRVLYVAMTRARDRLCVTALWPDGEKQLSRLREGLCSPIPYVLLAGDPSPAHWLARAALLPDSPLRLTLCPTSDLQAAAGAAAFPSGKAEAAAPVPASALAKLRDRLDWMYPHGQAAELPSKLTASALDGPWPADPDGTPLPGSVIPARPSRRPVLASGDVPLAAAERGVAVHRVLQRLDLARTGSREEIAGEIRRLLAQGHLTPAQAQAADPQVILDFFLSPTGRRILQASQVWRELRFSLLVPAENWFSVPPGEEILLQGVVDCCIREGGALTVIDYKTDRVSGPALEARAAYYAGQVRTYATAMERVLGKPVRECILYFLWENRAVSVPLPVK